MEMAWLHQQESKNLIVFCNGWGMDEGPVRHLGSSDFDVVMLFDYRDLSIPEGLGSILDLYQECHLIAWSMGVWAGQKIFADCGHSFTTRLAINGTLCPIHDDFGIPVNIFQATLKDFDDITKIKFYRRMCRDKSNLDMFLSSQPQRSTAEQKEELSFLALNADCIDSTKSIYNEVIISDRDWVVPSENQARFWRNINQHHISGYHYLFTLFQSWDHLVRFPDIGLAS